MIENKGYDQTFDDLCEEIDSELNDKAPVVKTLYKKLQQEIMRIKKEIPLFEDEVNNKIFIDEEMKKFLIELMDYYKKQKSITVLQKNDNHLLSLNEIVLDKLTKDPQTTELMFTWKKIIGPITGLFEQYPDELTGSERNEVLAIERKFKRESFSFFDTLYNAAIAKQFETFLNEKYSCNNIHIYPFPFKYE